MEKLKNIDEFILLVSDIRNISPQDFATYYPLEDKAANPKNLSFLEIENHFSSLQKFKVSENWSGYISLTSKIYLIYESFNKLSNEDKSIFINYFALIIKDASFKTQSFVSDKILSKKEYYNLLGIYQIFFNNLLFDILNELKNLVNTSLAGSGAAQSKELQPIPENAKHVFTNDRGYNLFLEMHNFFKKDRTKYLSNYSFLFWALEKEKLIYCRKVDFVDFVGNEEFDISIYKIDGRQKDRSYDTRKTLFENILKTL